MIGDTAIDIECAAPDDELLLADWLNALIFEMATRGMLFRRFVVALDDHRLVGKAWGERVDRARHHPAVEVKGATYTALSVAQRADGSVDRAVRRRRLISGSDATLRTESRMQPARAPEIPL